MRINKYLALSILVPLAAMAVSSCGQPTSPDQVALDRTMTQESRWAELTAEAEQAAKEGNMPVAEEKYKAAILEAEKLGEFDPKLARTVANLADFYYAQGAGERAEEFYKRAVAIREKAQGLEHVDIAADLIGLARVQAKKKEFHESKQSYERAIAILEKAGQEVPAEVKADYDEVAKLAEKQPPKPAAPAPTPAM